MTGQVTVPLAVIHGQGDPIVNWSVNGLALFNAAVNYDDLRVFYLMDFNADHHNIVGRFLATQAASEVWARTATLMDGFLSAYLRDDPARLEDVFGWAAQTEPKLVQLDAGVEEPELWTVGSPAIGQSFTVKVLGEPAVAAVFIGTNTATIPTSLGTLMLEPSSAQVLATGQAAADHTFSVSVSIPNEPLLIGMDMHFQGLGVTEAFMPRLTGLETLTITLQ